MRACAAAIVAPVRAASSTSSTGPAGAAPGASSASSSSVGRPVCKPMKAAGSRPLSGIATTWAIPDGSRQRLWLIVRARSPTVLKSVTASIGLPSCAHAHAFYAVRGARAKPRAAGRPACPVGEKSRIARAARARGPIGPTVTGTARRPSRQP